MCFPSVFQISRYLVAFKFCLCVVYRYLGQSLAFALLSLLLLRKLLTFLANSNCDRSRISKQSHHPSQNHKVVLPLPSPEKRPELQLCFLQFPLPSKPWAQMVGWALPLAADHWQIRAAALMDDWSLNSFEMLTAQMNHRSRRSPHLVVISSEHLAMVLTAAVPRRQRKLRWRTHSSSALVPHLSYGVRDHT